MRMAKTNGSQRRLNRSTRARKVSEIAMRKKEKTTKRKTAPIAARTLFCVLWGFAGLAACVSGGFVDEARARVVMDETVSALHPVFEADWLEVLEARAREADRLGLFDEKRRELEKSLERHAEHPVETGLPRAQSEDVHEVRIFSAARYAQVPVEARALVRGFSRTYVFVDANDAAQCAWLSKTLQALKEDKGARASGLRIVAAGGSLAHLTDVARKAGFARVWADQGAALVRRFSIKALPAVANLKSRRALVPGAVQADEGAPWEVVAHVRTAVVKDVDSERKDAAEVGHEGEREREQEREQKSGHESDGTGKAQGA